MTTPHRAGHAPAADTTAAKARPRLPATWRITLTLLAVALAAAVALWPRGHDPGPPQPTLTISPMRPTVDIAAARTKAALRPCPAPSPRGPGPSSLRGLWVTCLGDGSRIDLGAALAGHTTVINLWASWCEVCRKELPVLDAYARSPGAAHVLGVQILSGPADGLDLLAALGVRLPSVLDADNTVTTALRAPAYVPVSYLVTPDGTIRQVLPPTPFTSPAQVEHTVRTMMSGRH